MNASHDYGYPDAALRWDDSYVWQPVRRAVASLPAGARVCEIGCGNGVTASRLAAMGYQVTAVDPSESGIAAARAACPGVRFEVAEADASLPERLGTFDALVSIEVVEHCVSPKTFAACAAGLLRPGGLLVLTTPYHGYLKNLAIALTGRWDSHHDPLWEGGHVKFFSPATITRLLAGAGFAVQSIERVGRVQVLAKSMVVTAVAP